MTVTFFPIWIVDMVGAILMILFSLLCLKLVRQLRRRDEDNVIWTFEGRAGEVVTIDIEEDGSGIDTILALLGPDGKVLAEHDDIG